MLLVGTPDANRALAFDARGNVVAIGGTSTFGLAHLQRQIGETWTRAAGVAGFGSRAQLLGGGELPLYAVSESSLYRLDDVATFAWSALPIPQGATANTLFGVDGGGVVYALDLADGLENGAIVAWNPDLVRWSEVAGTRPLGVGASSFAVSASGAVAWAVPGIGVRGVEAGAQVTRIDCADCTIAHLAFDRTDTVLALACPGALIRGAQDAPLPSDQVTCHGADAIADGAVLLAGLDASGTGGGLFLATGTTWTRVAATSSAFTYVLRDRETAFAFADGSVERGIYQLSF